ncbi:excinuclease ABC subunit UvrC [Patescibacteria group bacterium]|nr:excinuclease ABC subunit UvrC [Patescibacteria group bacterium]
MIPKEIKIQNNELPDCPGVYLMKNAKSDIIYVGKATSLKRRVGSYFQRPGDRKTEQLVSNIKSIDYIEQPTAIEALFLEANLIKKYKPFYNIKEKDDKSYSYLVITNEDYPRPYVLRATDIDDSASKKYKAVYGPFTSSRAVRNALDIIRKAIPWSTCAPGQKRPCFYASLGQCPGVCTEAISKVEYNKIIRDLMAFFDGKRSELISRYNREMKAAAKNQKYEKAASLRNRLYALEHVRDVSVLAKDDVKITDEQRGAGGIFGRVEGYDISNISGTSSVGSMVVFRHGAPEKAKYRKFRIRTVLGPDDTKSLKEVLKRRFKHKDRGWEWPDLILIDGGKGQVSAAMDVIQSLNTSRVIPIIGIAKGPDRKKDELVIPPAFAGLTPQLNKHKDILVQVRDESHRFAINYHRKVRSESLRITKK